MFRASGCKSREIRAGQYPDRARHGVIYDGARDVGVLDVFQASPVLEVYLPASRAEAGSYPAQALCLAGGEIAAKPQSRTCLRRGVLVLTREIMMPQVNQRNVYLHLRFSVDCAVEFSACLPFCARFTFVNERRRSSDAL